MKFQISYPLNRPLTSQGFGANPQFYSNPIYGGIHGHNGIDFMAKHGEPVYATHDGIANFEIDNSGGHGVVITTEKTFDYKDGQANFKTIYWHLCDSLKEPQYKSPIEGKTNVPVKNGQIIGYADNTGASTGDHVHFGLKPMLNGSNLEQNNGYLGAIDPSPYFDGTSPDTIHNLEAQVASLSKLAQLFQSLISLFKKK